METENGRNFIIRTRLVVIVFVNCMIAEKNDPTPSIMPPSCASSSSLWLSSYFVHLHLHLATHWSSTSSLHFPLPLCTSRGKQRRITFLPSQLLSLSHSLSLSVRVWRSRKNLDIYTRIVQCYVSKVSLSLSLPFMCVATENLDYEMYFNVGIMNYYWDRP